MKKNHLKNKFSVIQDSQGFTLMEIIVATTIFAMVSVAMMSLFNYTLVINRRSEALRQATQGMRNFVELLVKEIRNGQINYLVVNNVASYTNISPCHTPGSSPAGTVYTASMPNSYETEENKLGIINLDGEEECIYLGIGGLPSDANYGNYVGLTGAGAFGSTASNPNPVLVLLKQGYTKEIVNPTNLRIEQLKFFIRPLKDPYSSLGGYAKVQPFVTINTKFTAKLSTGEEVPIYYQTTVSTNRYDVPN